MARNWNRITPDKRREILKLSAEGASTHQIVAKTGLSLGGVEVILRPLGGVITKDMLRQSSAYLSLEERTQIQVGLEAGESQNAIARRIGRSPSTVSRELKRNRNRRGNYGAYAANCRARERARRPKPTKLGTNQKLLDRVIADLKELWSPEQIARRLKQEFGDDVTMHISHETIYKSLYVQGRGELRRELARCLRSGRARRVHRGRLESRGRLRDMVLISERPPEVQDRAVPGHWEGDLLMGRNSDSAIGTLVERSTRFVMLFPLTKGKTAEHVREAMTETIQTLPATLTRTLTWDRGREMAEHTKFTIDTGIPVFFCDPQSPWQRGSNENTNGLLRQYFPKGMDLSKVTKSQLQRVADSLNNRPRKTLGWLKPTEKIAELVATTT